MWKISLVWNRGSLQELWYFVANDKAYIAMKKVPYEVIQKEKKRRKKVT